MDVGDSEGSEVWWAGVIVDILSSLDYMARGFLSRGI